MNFKNTSHVFHAVMCFLTGGLWLVVWIICALSNAQHNRSVEMKMMREQLDEMKRINRSS